MNHTPPERCTLVNSQTGERMTCQFNPPQLNESYKVKYARQAPIGAGTEHLHYTGTENGRWQMDFHLDSHDSHFNIRGFREFLLAFTRPSPASPPALILIWPNFITLTARVTDLSFHFDEFSASGKPRTFTAKAELEAMEAQHV